MAGRKPLVLALLAAVLSVLVVSPSPGSAAPLEAGRGLARATFAGGCFWCMEPPFDEVPGVAATISGYMGGQKKNPTYEEVSAGVTGHAEVVQILYDPKKVTYAELLEVFWRNIDPLAANRQFCDSGTQYRSAIFFHDESQRRLAEQSKAEKAKRFREPIVTQIVPASDFTRAEEYHQDFYKKSPVRYKSYRFGCGRDRRLAELWGKPAAAAK